MESSSDKRPTIQAEESSMESLMDGGGEVLADASEVLSRVNRALSDENIENISSAIADVKTTTEQLRASRGMFETAEQTLVRLDRAAADVEGAAQSARTAIEGDGREAFADVSAAARDLKAGIAEARTVIQQLDTATSGLAGPDGSGIAQTLESLDKAATEVEQLSRQLRRNPRERKLSE